MNCYWCHYEVIGGKTSSAPSQIQSITSSLALRRLGPSTATGTGALRCAAPGEAFVGVGLSSALGARGESVLACIPGLGLATLVSIDGDMRTGRKYLSRLDARGARRVHWSLARHDDICRLSSATVKTPGAFGSPALSDTSSASGI